MRNHHEYKHHPVTLTLSQFHKLRKGHTVQLAHHQIDPSKHHKHRLTLHPANHQKVAQAARNRRGVRLGMSADEFNATGTGFGDFWNKIKSGLSTAGSWIKNNVLDSDIYKNSIRPIVHGLVDQGINAAATLAGSKAGPLGQQIAGDVGHAAANKFFDATGVGLYHRVAHRRKRRGSSPHPRRVGGALRGGYEPNRYGHGSTQGEVAMSARDVRKVMPASEFTPLLSPAKYPSLIQHSQAIKGSGMKRGRKPRGRHGGVVGGSFRL